jgi:hypothetical protein
MAKMKLLITDQDIASAERYKISNPVLHKLQNTTGTLWRLFNDGLAVEAMSPFRATLLPLWATNGWHERSVNRNALPYQLELELYQLQPDIIASKNYTPDNLDLFAIASRHPSPAMTTEKCAPRYEAVQNALLQVLEINGWPNWRAVCPHIFAEGSEPYRTIVLDKNALHAAQEWLQSPTEPLDSQQHEQHEQHDGSTPDHEVRLCLSATLHSPLTGDPPQSITIHFPPRTF